MSLTLRFGRGDALAVPSGYRATAPAPPAAGHLPDELTGLEARLAFRERVELMTAQPSPAPGAVLVVDLDRFREIDDSHGQLAGDAVLQVTASRLACLCPPGAGLYRVAGDQFAVVLDRGFAADAIPLARSVFVAVQEPVRVPERALRLSASVAIVMVEGPQSADEVLRRAATAVFATKVAGGRQIYAYSCELDEWAAARHRQVETLAAEVEQLRAQNQILAASALVDPVTGLPNGSAFTDDHARVDARRRRTGDPYSVVLVDLDWFYDYGQTFGAESGDRALASIAGQVGACARPGDRAYRYGEDELAVLLPGASASEAVAIAERIRLAVQTLAIPHPANPSGVLTATIGVVEGGFRHADPVDVLAEAAEMVLSGKRGGRNRIAWPH